MTQIIRVSDIYATKSLFTRSMAIELSRCLNPVADEVILVFTGIEFLSRSFADEVCNMIDDHAKVDFKWVNCNEVVSNMLSKVKLGRTKERERGLTPPKILQFDSLESLKAFLATIDS